MEYKQKYIKYKTKYINLSKHKMSGGNNFVITSSAFTNSDNIPKSYSCDIKNANMFPLEWKNPPVGTKSFALIIEDPDVPNLQPGKTFTHLVVWNIDKNATSINNFAQINNNAGLNSTNKHTFVPMCPPRGHGIHRYFVKLYALDTILDLSKNSDTDKLRSEMKKHILGVATLMGKYKRS